MVKITNWCVVSKSAKHSALSFPADFVLPTPSRGHRLYGKILEHPKMPAGQTLTTTTTEIQGVLGNLFTTQSRVYQPSGMNLLYAAWLKARGAHAILQTLGPPDTITGRVIGSDGRNYQIELVHLGHWFIALLDKNEVRTELKAGNHSITVRLSGIDANGTIRLTRSGINTRN